MKAELKDVLHLYRGCDIVCEEIRYTLKAVMIDGEDHDENQEIWVIAENKHREDTFNLEDSKPILRQLLDLKRDEIIQFFKLKGIECHRGVFRTGIEGQFVQIEYNNTNKELVSDWQDIRFINAFQFAYLLEKEIDLFELIESGKAIDKTKLNK